MDQAKPRTETFAPFKIIGKCPGKITFDIYTVTLCMKQRPQVVLEIGNAGDIVDRAIHQFIPECGAIFRDNYFFLRPHTARSGEVPGKNFPGFISQPISVCAFFRVMGFTSDALMMGISRL